MLSSTPKTSYLKTKKPKSTNKKIPPLHIIPKTKQQKNWKSHDLQHTYRKFLPKLTILLLGSINVYYYDSLKIRPFVPKMLYAILM